MKSIYNLQDLFDELMEEVVDKVVDGEEVEDAVEEVVTDLFAMLRTDDEVLYNFVCATDALFDNPFKNADEIEEYLKVSLVESLNGDSVYELKSVAV